MKKLFPLLIIGLFMISSCNNLSKYPDYAKTDSQIFYKLIVIGEDTVKANAGDYITVDIAYRTMKDSLFFFGRRIMQIAEPQFIGSIEECFLMMAEGDSISFILSADNFFEKTLGTSLPQFLVPQSDMKVDIKMIDFRPEEQYLREKEEFLKWIEDFGEYEQMVLKRFIEEEEIEVEPVEGGFYYLPVKEGTDKNVELGDLVTVHYEGKFLNGKYFDSTRKRNMPLEFVYGTEWQVIDGLEKGIGMMSEGERAIFIFPSNFAFGEKGSTTGIIPPFTSVVFDVEIVKVIDKDKIEEEVKKDLPESKQEETNVES
jgi:FKBP-type peptidyl-prolyl cis-trans isomerase FkpA